MRLFNRNRDEDPLEAVERAVINVGLYTAILILEFRAYRKKVIAERAKVLCVAAADNVEVEQGAGDG